jgi:hypothetical protein
VYPAFRDETPRRSWGALAGALILHGAVAGLAFRSAAPAPESTAAPTTATAFDEIAIETAEERAIPEWPGASIDSSNEASASPRRLAAAREERRPEPSDMTAPSPEGSGQSGDDGYALDPSAPRGQEGKRVDLGIAPGDWSHWVDPTARVEAPRPPKNPNAPPASTTGGVAEALEAHDREVGLGPAGPIVSAAHEAGHSDVAPAIGTAKFSITVMKSGGIEVTLVGASSNAEGWRRVADKMAVAIKKKPPRIDGGRNGVHIGLELVAEERWPNGQVARSEGPALTLSMGSVQATDKAIDDLSKRNPFAVPPPGSPSDQAALKLNVDMPGLYLKGRGKVCSYQVGLVPMIGPVPIAPIFSGGCDPSNIGAPAQRVVSAKVTEQTML